MNEIICGDSNDILPTIPEGVVNLVVTDPPYEFISKNPVGGGFMKKENKKHLEELNESFGMSFDPGSFLFQIKRICHPFNAYIFTNKSLLSKYIKFAEDNKYKWDLMILAKTNPVPINNNHYLMDKEYAIMIRETGSVFNSKLGYEKYFTVKKISIGNREFDHPTVKPIEVIKSFIEISSNAGQTILDPYLGSGTTAVACKELNRKCIGIELQKNYIDITESRLSQNKII